MARHQTDAISKHSLYVNDQFESQLERVSIIILPSTVACRVSRSEVSPREHGQPTAFYIGYVVVPYDFLMSGNFLVLVLMRNTSRAIILKETDSETAAGDKYWSVFDAEERNEEVGTRNKGNALSGNGRGRSGVVRTIKGKAAGRSPRKARMAPIRLPDTSRRFTESRSKRVGSGGESVRSPKA